jgi:putative SOS response-associated peptidase YedK
MCSRFDSGRRGLTPEQQRLEDEFVVAFQGLAKRSDIAPHDSSVVLARGKGGILRPVAMRWGFDRPFGVVFNARSEELGKPMWRDADRKRRCAVPMAAFYEWSGHGRWCSKHRFTALDRDEDLWAAGLWESPEPGALAFTILTQPAPKWMELLHDRCPALMRREEVEPYLDARLSAAEFAGVSFEQRRVNDDGNLTLPGFD